MGRFAAAVVNVQIRRMGVAVSTGLATTTFVVSGLPFRQAH